ncbi:MAG: TVP38/TMEM64 family protein [Candidatus Promineifilaceae bacterium]
MKTLTLVNALVGRDIGRKRSPFKKRLPRFRRKAHRSSFASAIAPTQKQVKQAAIIGGGSALVAAGLYLTTAHSLTPIIVVNRFASVIITSRFGPLIYIAGTVILPLVFFPQTFMTIAGGVLYGVWYGTLLATGAQAIGAWIGHMVGQQIGDQTPFGQKMRQHIDPYLDRLHSNQLETVMLTRLIYLPHEVITYACGILGVDTRPFLIGTILGTLPSTVFLVHVGAAITGSVITGAIHINPVGLALSGGAAIISGLTAIYIRNQADRSPKNVIVDMAPHH